LSPHPILQCLQLDGLLGRDQSVGERKSVFFGGTISSAGQRAGFASTAQTSTRGFGTAGGRYGYVR